MTPPAPKKAETPSKIDELAILYVIAGTAHVCELDLSDSEDEKLQKNVDDAEEAAGLSDEIRDGMWNKVIADISRDKKKSCADFTSEAIAAIRSMKE